MNVIFSIKYVCSIACKYYNIVIYVCILQYKYIIWRYIYMNGWDKKKVATEMSQNERFSICAAQVIFAHSEYAFCTAICFLCTKQFNRMQMKTKFCMHVLKNVTYFFFVPIHKLYVPFLLSTVWIYILFISINMENDTYKIYDYPIWHAFHKCKLLCS